MAATTSSTLTRRVSQQDIYQLLNLRGSRWLKSHVLYADRQVVVLNKPPNIVSQLGYPGRRKERESNQSKPLDPIFDDIRRWLSSADPYPVHRLDKATTGCLLIALNASNAKSLSQQFEQGTVHKTYLALVRGGKKSFTATSGRISAPLTYVDGRGDISPDGKFSLTDWELLAFSALGPVSLLKLNLLTGNKHQLRIHLAQCLKTPILGDTIHSRTPLHPSIPFVTVVPEGRLFLHAAEISFFKYHDHGKRYRFGIRSPVPADFKRICRDVGITIPRAELEGALLIDDQVVEDRESESSLWNPLSLPA